MQGDGLRKLAELYASKDCELECEGCELNKPIFEWSEDPKLCAWVQHLDNEFEGDDTKTVYLRLRAIQAGAYQHSLTALAMLEMLQDEELQEIFDSMLEGFLQSGRIKQEQCRDSLKG